MKDFGQKNVRSFLTDLVDSRKMILRIVALLLAVAFLVPASEACGGNFTGPNGTFTSPNYPHNHGNNENCKWFITVDSGHTILLFVSISRLESCCDFISVFEDHGTTELIGRYTGESQSIELESQGNTMAVTFTSDVSVVNKGFDAQFFELNECSSSSNHYGSRFVESYINDTTRIYTAQCSDGFHRFDVTRICENETILHQEQTCEEYDIQEVRLTNGTDRFNGRVEVRVNNTWGTVCGQSFDDTHGHYNAGSSERNAFCRAVQGSGYLFYTNSRYGRGDGPVFLDRLRCSSSTNDPNSCRYSRLTNCTDNEILSVNCYGRPDISGVRVSETGSPEVNYDGVWQEFCSSWFTEVLATTICRMLNKGLKNYARSGESAGMQDSRRIYCYGGEDNLSECRMYNYVSSCTGSKKIYIHCSECLNTNNYYGSNFAESSNASVVFSRCSDGFDTWNITRFCENDTIVHQNGSCEAYDIQEVRLTNGTDRFNGRVEIRVDNTWGTVCGWSVDETYGYYSARSSERNTFCKAIQSSGHQYYTNSRYGRGDGPVFLDQLRCTSSANDPKNCRYNRLAKCTDNGILSVSCYGRPDVNGVRVSETGTPEINYDGIWQEFCSDWFNEGLATSICKALNKSLVNYDISDEPVGMQDSRRIYCSGAETNISDCQINNYISSCTRSKRIYIQCSECLSPDAYYGSMFVESGNASSPVFTSKCSDGFNTWNVTRICENDTLVDQNGSCGAYDIQEVRLSNGTDRFNGRVEFRVNNTWGVVCGMSDDPDKGRYTVGYYEARSLCSAINGGGTYRRTTNSRYGRGDGPILLDRLNCYNSVVDLNRCIYSRVVQCTDENILSVNCYGIPNINGVRLSSSGIPEINYEGNWQSVCASWFHKEEGIVLCRMLNKSLSFFEVEVPVESSNIQRETRYIGCSGSESSFQRCSIYSFINDCTNSQRIKMGCSGCGELSVQNGRVVHQIDDGDQVIISCDYGSVFDNFTAECLDGNWVFNATCELYGYPLDINGVRLTGGTNERNGRLEVLTNSTWGTVCSDDFEYEDGDVFCRMMNSSFRVAGLFPTTTNTDVESIPIHMDRVNCIGSEQHVENCTYVVKNTCDHSKDVTLICNECGRPDASEYPIIFLKYEGDILVGDCTTLSPRNQVGNVIIRCTPSGQWQSSGECQTYVYPLPITSIRLFGGTTSSQGRVEIQAFGHWGTVCRHGIGAEEANVLCRMIGFSFATSFYTDETVSLDSGAIFVNNLDCTGSEQDINHCMYDVIDNCTHAEDIYITCRGCDELESAGRLLNDTSTTVGTVVAISCDDGYRLVGNSVITCLDSAMWSDNTTCIFIDCEDPSPTYGYVNSTASFAHNVVLEVGCDVGYHLDGESIITCQYNGSWTGYPICVLIDCQIPSVPYANIDVPRTTFGETALVTCFDGFLPTGSWTITCLASGYWSESNVNCSIVDCGDPTPTDGYTNTTDTTYGTVVEITCTGGQQIQGQAVITCHADGTWSGNPICNSQDCGRPSISNADVNTPNGTTDGQLATIVCHEGYDIIGPSVLACSLGQWNDTTSCVIQECGTYIISNGEITSSTGTDYGDVVNVRCNTGYVLNGSPTISCLDGGVWSEEPHCSLIDCAEPTSPNNGGVSFSSGTIFGSTVTYYCKPGFVIEGPAYGICDVSGEWSKGPPVCVAMSPIGGGCTNKDYCLTANAVCTDGICICVTGLSDPRSNTCDIMPLLSHGAVAGDKFLSSTCCPKITFQPGIPLFDKMFRTIYVNPNGYVSLGKMYTLASPRQSSKYGDNSIIAPYFSRINEKDWQKVSYRSYDIIKDYPFNANISEEVHLIENVIHKIEKRSDFRTKFALIVTWNKVQPYLSKKLLLNLAFDATFQLVLVTDGVNTFAMYIYGYGQINWFSNSNKPEIWIGYNVDAKRKRKHILSFTSSAMQLHKHVETQGVKSLIVLNLVDADLTDPNPAIECIDWYNTNKHLESMHAVLSERLPQCPCQVSLARWDPWYWKIRFQLRWWWWWWWWGYSRPALPEIMCVNMTEGNLYNPYGKACCYYRSTYKFIEERPHAGGFFFSHPNVDAVKHAIDDVSMKDKCCVQSSFCNLYYRLHPIGSCYTRSPYNLGSFWGDPHFQTLDGANFTFNGLGEYTLLSIHSGNITFDLQARTERAVKEDGNLSDATVFSAFAGKDNMNASFHVELNVAKNGMVLYANGLDLTSQVNRVNSTFEYASPIGNLDIAQEEDGSLSILFPFSGVSLNVSVKAQMLSLTTIVPQTLAGIGKGLLGNFDGDPSNDLTSPEGERWPTNSTERDIFAYGQTWAINASDSAFVYADGKTHADFHNATYVPRFLDEVNKTKIDEAAVVCNGTSNTECIFDYVFTEKKEVAVATNSIRSDNDQQLQDIKISVPVLSGCSELLVNAGEVIHCSLDYNNNESLIINFVENDVNATLDQDNRTVVFTIDPTASGPVVIRVVAENEAGITSQPYQVQAVVCSGCSGHGQCLNETRSGTDPNDYIKYQTCQCDQRYDGDNCEMELDWCITSPCSLERECTFLPVSSQISLNMSYDCGPCPNGYITEGTECLDIDECETSTHTCEQVCTNNDGGYECSCNTGYRIDTRNSSLCKDVNECIESVHNCTQVCQNNAGGFLCDCQSGFMFNYTTWNCDQAMDYDPCSASDLNCTATAGCTVLDSNDTSCFCLDGYQLDESGLQCIDVDECDKNLCPHDCNNTYGSFQCICYNGYQLTDKTTCTECDDSHWGPNCGNDCACYGSGAETCDPVRGCICRIGWTGSACDDDVNECDGDDDVCIDPKTTCRNTVGSYTCDCIAGFRRRNATCEDIDECSSADKNSCQQKCTNTVGGYTCGCNGGYTRENDTHCRDIDECSLGTSGCEQLCDNLPGLYNCYCYFGYRLNDDRHSCIKLSDPCLTINNLNCSGFCRLKDNVTECRCQGGYVLGPDHQTCIDVNECLNDTLNQCGNKDNCINTEGSFLCSCPIGQKLENDQRTCSDCDEYHYGQNCSLECSCLNGVCHNVNGCQCDSGWSGTQCDVDINECITYSCTQSNTECVNMPGSFRCRCKHGFSWNNGTGLCEDINECMEINSNNCDHICDNTIGSFTCRCRAGFHMINAICVDIVECDSKHDCSQICENTIGSYRCSCEEGFRINPSNLKECLPERECTTTDSDICPNNSDCTMAQNGPQCLCHRGYETKDGTCIDKDECQVDTPCSQNCTNTAGGFQCSCRDGFYLMEDTVTCSECIQGMHGPNCLLECPCEVLHTDSCDPETGRCACLSNWKGDNCTVDVNECEDGLFECIDHSHCLNTQGGYDCLCDTGYSLENFVCKECGPFSYGQNCQSTCPCNITNTAFCDHVTGNCSCEPGWTGTNCNADVDECDVQDICPEHSNCINTAGSYKCVCYTGYHNIQVECKVCDEGSFGDNCTSTCLCNATNTERCDNVNGSCICVLGWEGAVCDRDIDECAANPPSCPEHSACQNTPGAHTCTCDEGYIMVGQSCEECSQWQFGYNCSQQCGCNTSNTAHCNNVDGACSCKTGWTDDICSHDVDECVNATICASKLNSTCVNSQGGYSCYCNAGYHEHLERCEDVNECDDMNNCTGNASCQNSIGSYHCYCPSGMQLTDDGFSCIECDNLRYGENCAYLCGCQHGVCNKQAGSCRCDSGWKGINCTIDVNECLNTSFCKGANEECVNTLGSADCLCTHGFSRNTTSDICDDNDECLVNGSNLCGHHCHNTDGSYVCSCYEGYKLLSNNSCQDVNECKQAPCDQLCENTDGSFSCYCDEGFYLDSSDNRSCLVIKECSEQEISACPSHSTCWRNHTEHDCRCHQGYIKNGTVCEDINECLDNPCDQGCTNLPGAYNCTCTDGFAVVDKTTCQACDDFHFGVNCSSTCHCQLASSTCDKVNGQCHCMEGWTSTQCDQDIDECNSDNAHNCTENSQCVNTEWGYTCDCDIGFVIGENSQCDACVNFKFGEDCSVDCDCTIDNSMSCNNVNGSCLCEPGWTNSKCETDINECDDDSTECRANSRCVNTLGSYTCPCSEGYREENGECRDINECDLDKRLCDQNCTNLPASYRCSCTIGYVLQSDNSTCQTCDDDHFGVDCSSTCECQLQSSTCDKVNGQCHCMEGWNGTLCDQDIDECISDSTYNCTENSYCQNVDGGYTCVCNIGYQKTTGECKVCTDHTYGINCTQNCVCNAANAISQSQSCGTVRGECQCNSNWAGADCNTDVNECLNSDICINESNTGCHNTPGGYRCACMRGFATDGNGACVPVQVTTTPQPTQAKPVDVKLEITLDVVVDDSVNLEVEATYEEVKTKVATSLMNFYSQYTNETLRIIIISIRRGSLIVEHRVESDSTSNEIATDLTRAASKLVQGAIIKYDGQNVTATSADLDLCAVLTQAGGCDEGDTCEIQDSQPICKPTSTRNMYGLIVGFSIGGFILLLSVALLGMCVRQLRKAQSSKKRLQKRNDRSVSRPNKHRDSGHDVPIDPYAYEGRAPFGHGLYGRPSFISKTFLPDSEPDVGQYDNQAYHIPRPRTNHQHIED